MRLKDILESICYTNLDSAEEIAEAVNLIIEVQDFKNREVDTLLCAFNQGPLFDGDLPSKEARNTLIDKGYICKIIVKGEDGFNACTQKGALANKLLISGVLRNFKSITERGVNPTEENGE